jgi:hypothetical protein
MDTKGFFRIPVTIIKCGTGNLYCLRCWYSWYVFTWTRNCQFTYFRSTILTPSDFFSKILQSKDRYKLSRIQGLIRRADPGLYQELDQRPADPELDPVPDLMFHPWPDPEIDPVPDPQLDPGPDPEIDPKPDPELDPRPDTELDPGPNSELDPGPDP